MEHRELIFYYFEDAERSMCPKCLKHQIRKFWDGNALPREQLQMREIIETITDDDWPILELIEDPEFEATVNKRLRQMSKWKNTKRPCKCPHSSLHLNLI